MSKEVQATSGRRDFIRLAGLGVAAGSVGLAAGIAPAAAAVPVAEVARPGYRETDHVKKAYEVARF